MPYLCNNPDLSSRILAFIDEYTRAHAVSPSIRDVAAGTGISRATVQRYMAAMRDRGEIDYGRRSVTTEFTRKLDSDRVVAGVLGSVSCGIPKEPYTAADEFVSLPRAWLGDGVFFVVRADGDSMTDAGIDDGDLVVVRSATDARDGEIAVVLVDGTETVLKRFFRLGEDRGVLLRAENRTYPPHLRERTVRDAAVQGVAVTVVKRLR